MQSRSGDYTEPLSTLAKFQNNQIETRKSTLLQGKRTDRWTDVMGTTIAIRLSLDQGDDINTGINIHYSSSWCSGTSTGLSPGFLKQTRRPVLN